jgi:hypothetical protein
MNDIFSKISAIGVFLLKLIGVLCVVRMVTYALGVYANLDVPVIDDVIRIVGIILKTLTFGFTDFLGDGLNRV